MSKRVRAASAAPAISKSIYLSALPRGGKYCGFRFINLHLSSLKHKANSWQTSRIPENLTIALNSHTKAVSTLQWYATHSHFLASAGMDHIICVWNVWNRVQQKARVFSCHEAAVKDVRWFSEELSLLSCGYDCSPRLIDVEKGTVKQVFKEDKVLTTVRFQPVNSNLFPSGSSKVSLRFRDIRLGKIVCEHVRDLRPILDIEFSADTRHFYLI